VWSGAKKPASEFAHLPKVSELRGSAAEAGENEQMVWSFRRSSTEYSCNPLLGDRGGASTEEQDVEAKKASDVQEESKDDSDKPAEKSVPLTLRELRWKKTELAIDVMIPCYAEDLHVLKETIEHCNAMWVPQEVRRVTVWLLDDGGKSERAELCEQLGARYHLREDKGKHAKAGNLNAALRISRGDLVLILDADMAPEQHCLLALLEPMLKVHYILLACSLVIDSSLHADGVPHCVYPGSTSVPRLA
jgi:hypothetical protein